MNKNYWDEHRDEKKVYSKEYWQREIECEVCECKVRKCNWTRHLGTRSICWGVVVEKLMMMWGGRGDDTKGKAKPYHYSYTICIYLEITVIASSNTNWQSVWHLRGDIVRKKSKNIDLSFQSIPIAGEDWLRYLEKPRKSKKYVWFLPCFNQININKQTKTTSIQQSMLSCKKL